MVVRTNRWLPAVALATTLAATLLAASLLGAGPAVAGPGRTSSHPSADGTQPRVVGGKQASPGQFPWMARLSMGCGGAVLSSRVVLTAAHCVAGTGPTSGIEVTTGRTSLSGTGGQTLRSDYVLRSPRYGQQGTVDWALVELDRPTGAPTLALAGQGDTTAENGVLTVAGWGATVEGGPQSDRLRFATVPRLDDAVCAQAYPAKFHPDTELCAGYPQGGVDACQGDSGGPMVTSVAGRTVEVGIVSYGRGCARPGSPGVYAEVPAFSEEIAGHLGPGGELVR